MLLYVSVAFALSPAEVWSAMDGQGWADAGSKNTSVGEVAVRHLPLDGVDCLEASAVTALDVEKMKQIVLDIRGNPEWSSADLRLSWVLREDASSMDYVQVLNNPAPIADRYWYLRGSWGDFAEGWALTWQHFDGEGTYPEQHAELTGSHGSAVPVAFNLGSWAFLPAEGGTLARFRSCSDAGGNVPRWAGEAAARLMLPNNIEDLFVAAAE